jgi:hypothetical protein
MTLASAIVDVGTLLKVIEVSLVAGIGVTIAYSLVIWGSTRASDLAQREQLGLAIVHGLIAAVALAGTTAAIAYGLHVMASK